MSFLNIIPERDEEPTRSERSFVIPRRTEEVLEAEGEITLNRFPASSADFLRLRARMNAALEESI